MSIWLAKDKKIQSEIYRNSSRHLIESKTNPVVLDIGVAVYNDVTKNFFDEKVKFFQLEPFKNSSCYNNDGFFECFVEKIDELPVFQNIKNKFDMIFDFGVFGWNGVKLKSHERLKYMENIHYMLKDDGIFVLHNDRVKRKKENELNLEENIFKLFKPTTFLDYKSHIKIEDKNTIWDIRFLKK